MRTKLPVIAALLAGAAIALIAVLLIGGDDGGKASADRPKAVPAFADGNELEAADFSLRYPKKGWQQLTRADLGKRGSGAVAGIKRSTNDAVVLVQQRGRLEQPLDDIAEDLTKRLKKSVADFRFVGSEKVKLDAGDAVTYTFLRTKSDQVQNLVVVPSAEHTYTLNSVIGGGAPDAAKEVAAIVKTFDPEK